MSSSQRGAEATGIPKTGANFSTILVLDDRNAGRIYYSLTDTPMFDKMVELGVFGSVETAKNNIRRLKDCAS